MLLFQKRFHQGLIDGSITLTFRAWPRAKVKPGGRYRCHPIGVLEVDAIDRVRAATISAKDARRAGFASRDELFGYLEQVMPGARAAGEVFRVRLHHGGDGDRVALALESELTAEERRAIKERLRRLDERSGEPWTTKTLALIARHPRTAASQLAAKLGRETLEFKADVVKLKKLGLTQSFEVGYEISPRGRALRGKARPRKPAP